MLKDKDIQKIKEGLATKEDLKDSTMKILSLVATKEEFKEVKQDLNGLRESIQALTLAVDKLVKSTEDLHQEYAAITAKVDRNEKWIQQLANKLGIKLEY